MPFLRRLYQYRLLILLWLVVIVVGFIGALLQFWQTLAAVPQVPVGLSKPVAVAPEPQYALASPEARPILTARSLWVYDRQAKQVLLAENADVATAPASLVKMMTALVAFENLDLDQAVTIGSASSIPGNRAKFLPQDQFSVRDLLKTMLLFSANDAGEALANAGASPTTFIEQMNAKAADFGLSQTHFTNVTGLDEAHQYSSAHDLGLLADHFLQNPFLADTVSHELATVEELRTGRLDTVYTTNSLLHQGPQFAGIKTGTTDLAGQNLVFRYQDAWEVPYPAESETETRNLDLIVVILGSQDRYTDALTLMDWLHSALRMAENPVR